MNKLLLGVTGSVAAIKTLELYQTLRSLKFEVRIVATSAATYFFDPDEIIAASGGKIRSEVVVLDEDEWPRRSTGGRYDRGDEVLHIELRKWANLFLVAPLDANSLAKFAHGLADNCLTSVWRAWDFTKPVVLAPAMNTFMWDNPHTSRQLRGIATDFGAAHIPGSFPAGQLVAHINERCPRLKVVGPVAKELACGDVGMGGMASVEEIAETVARLCRICLDQPTENG